ncbi:glycosyltransferase [Clostridium butyricum]|uniref:glycosyltransferase n=1 Tax=Clostridium butyricum TaxID=1492 RepID=UPI0034656DC5
MKKVHIIISIDSDMKNLEMCIESIIRYTNLEKHKVSIINNAIKYRDYNLSEKYAEYIDSNYNNEKCNFSEIINDSMEKNDEDIILLNSNVIVTEEWLEKLYECAYSDETIGAVVPLSNNWSFSNENKFKKCDIEKFSKQISRLSMKKYPRINFINGFCLYIKKDVLKLVSLLEEDKDQQGYDLLKTFCIQSNQLGYHEVLCDSLFVYNLNENINLIDNHKNLIGNEYIEKYINNNIEVASVLSNKKKNILYLLQSDFHEEATNNIGGTQLHVKDLVMGLKDKYNIYVAARDGEYLRFTIYAEEKCIVYKFNIGNIPEFYVFRDKLQSELYKSILQIFLIDIVHIHHTLDLSLDLYYEARELNIPIITTLHDFFYVCPCIKLVNYKNELCIGLETKEMCSKCLEKKFGIDSNINFIKNWRKENIKALKLCDKLITPSNSAKKIFSSYFSELTNKIQVIEHGSEKYIYNEISKNSDEWILTDDINSNFEYVFDEPSNKQLIKGWAYIIGKESKNSYIYIQIIDEHGNEKIIKTNMDKRLDVANAVMDEKYINSGFSLIVPRDIFKNGKLFINIIIINDDVVYKDSQHKTIRYKQYIAGEKFNVAFIGGMSPEKGSQLAYKTIVNSPADINWYVFGGIGDEDLAELQQDNLIKTGWYRREDLYSLVNLFNIDLICILPIWPETFCYTLSEALLCEVPVLGTDIGAVGERIKKLGCGWTIPLGSDYNDILSLIDYIKNNSAEYKKILTTVKKLKIDTIDYMLSNYIKVYESKDKINRICKYDLNFSYETYLLNNSILLSENNERNEKEFKEGELIYKIKQLENELNLIYKSKGYRLLKIIRKLKNKFM